MGSGFDLSSIFGGSTANASGLGSILSGLTSGLGSGLQGGQSIGGNQASNNAIADALGWTYGYGDQTGSITAQESLAMGPGGDGTGPTALGAAGQYMQGQQQTPPDQTQADTGQATPAQQAMAQQPPVSLAQAYGAQGPWAPGGSASPQAAAQGPQGFTQVAGPAQAATSAAGLQGQPTPGDRFAGSTALSQGMYNDPRFSPFSRGAPATPYAGVPDPVGGGANAPGTYGVGTQGPDVMSTYGGVQRTPGSEAYTDPTAGRAAAATPTPQARPAAANAAPAQMMRSAAAPAAGATPPAANDPVTQATQAVSGQGAQQANPVQAIMQALGLQNLPPQAQQMAQQIIRQIISQLMPQLQGQMGGQQGQQFGGGQGPAIDPRTGRPPINPKTGQPYPAGTRWDQIAWSQGWDPAQQRQGVPWRQWENVPRSASESGAPTASPAGSTPGTSPPVNRPAVPANPPPVIRAPRTMAQLQTAPESWERPLTREELRREQMRGMTPQEMKKLRERIRKMHERRIETAQAS